MTSHRTNTLHQNISAFFALLFSFFSSSFFFVVWLEWAEVLFTAEYVEQLKPEVVSDGRGEEQVRAAQRPTHKPSRTTTPSETNSYIGHGVRESANGGAAAAAGVEKRLKRKPALPPTHAAAPNNQAGDCGLWKPKSGCRQFGRRKWLAVCVRASVIVDRPRPPNHRTNGQRVRESDNAANVARRRENVAWHRAKCCALRADISRNGQHFALRRCDRGRCAVCAPESHTIARARVYKAKALLCACAHIMYQSIGDTENKLKRI